MPRRQPDPDEAGPGRAGLSLLLELTTLLGADMERDLRGRGLTQSRVPVLWVLGELGPSTQRVLADRLGVSPRNVTGLVDGLVETGFVTREPHPADRRAVLVTPTARGAAELEGLGSAYDALAGQLFGDLHPATLDAVVAGLDEIVGRLRGLIDESHP